jgi:hypothetical protein
MHSQTVHVVFWRRKFSWVPDTHTARVAGQITVKTFLIPDKRGSRKLTYYDLSVFLTLRARVDYTNKFDTCHLDGLTAALC